MLDEEQEAPEAEATDDAGGDDAVDLADLGGEVETADEPAVTAEELMEIPDAPETPGPDELSYAHPEVSELGAQAAAEDAGSGGDDAGGDDAGDDDAGDDDAGGDESDTEDS